MASLYISVWMLGSKLCVRKVRQQEAAKMSEVFFLLGQRETLISKVFWKRFEQPGLKREKDQTLNQEIIDKVFNNKKYFYSSC